jgi:excisionase family DNA binding protein
MENIMNMKELADYLHCSVMSVRRMIYEKKIQFFRIGNRYYFKLNYIESWINKQLMQNLNEGR